jgi:hypothetical protein
VNHFESRLDVMDGKGIIVCMSRRICIDLYDQIIKLRLNWNMMTIEFIFLAAGKGYIPVLFFQLTLFSAEKWCQWLANQI